MNQNTPSPMAEYGKGTTTFTNKMMNKNGKQPGDSLRKPHWDMNALMPFEKDFYVPHENVASRWGYHFINLLFLRVLNNPTNNDHITAKIPRYTSDSKTQEIDPQFFQSAASPPTLWSSVLQPPGWATEKIMQHDASRTSQYYGFLKDLPTWRPKLQ